MDLCLLQNRLTVLMLFWKFLFQKQTNCTFSVTLLYVNNVPKDVVKLQDTRGQQHLEVKCAPKPK